MARLPVVDPAASPDAADALARTRSSRGWVSNLLGTLAHSPEAQRHHSAYGHYLRFESDLTDLQRELVIVATVRGVEYAWRHHAGLLQQLGITNEQLAAISRGEVPQGLAEADAALCAYVFAFAAYRGVPDAVFAELRRLSTTGRSSTSRC